MMNQNLFPLASDHPLRLADLLIRAAAIYSMAQDRALYQAIAIRDAWIVAVSLDPHGLDGLIGADTHVLDAPDLTILPAFEDTHNHLMLAAQNTGLVPVDRAHTLAGFIDLIRQRATQTPPGTWIQTSAAWQRDACPPRLSSMRRRGSIPCWSGAVGMWWSPTPRRSRSGASRGRLPTRRE